ncbi:MAG: transposase [Desulfobacterales bacterium]|nr:transposase [Desulfobacterales bacterium]
MVSYIYDHSLGRSVLGFCTVTLGLLTESGFYVIDFSYRFGKKRHPGGPGEIIGDPMNTRNRYKR